MNHVTVIGAGLAGSECAWQLAQRGKTEAVNMIFVYPILE